jgi:hypothetical protein
VRDQFEVQFGDPGDIPVPADYDGDGTLDAAVFRPRTGTWHIRDHTIVPYGVFGDLPVPGDYDGDGKADIAIYRPSSGEWWVRNQDRGDLWRRVAGWFGRGSN